MCGEKYLALMSSESDRGSPPRMRGKDAGCLVHHEKHRITPAYAGKRCLGHLFQVELRDHPRVCGEKQASSCTAQSLLGSPPRVRGKALRTLKRGFAIRITPVYAGKSSRPCRRKSKTRDHPRVCGEKWSFAALVWIIWGSPPRMRGKGRVPAAITARRGITPACAGKRERPHHAGLEPEDHPRVCGEKCSATGSGLAVSGSPPRMRGKGVIGIGKGPSGGITPAHAGKSIFLYRCVVLCCILFRAIRQSTP